MRPVNWTWGARFRAWHPVARSPTTRATAPSRPAAVRDRSLGLAKRRRGRSGILTLQRGLGERRRRVVGSLLEQRVAWILVLVVVSRFATCQLDRDPQHREGDDGDRQLIPATSRPVDCQNHAPLVKRVPV